MGHGYGAPAKLPVLRRRRKGPQIGAGVVAFLRCEKIEPANRLE
jgi:hypothetical protein